MSDLVARIVARMTSENLQSRSIRTEIGMTVCW